jgi:hypothetical protein
MGPKTALLVYPDYTDSGFSELDELDVDLHVNTLTEVLEQRGFTGHIPVLRGRVTKACFETAITGCVEQDPEVFLLVFCGHGNVSGQLGSGGALCLSDGTQISENSRRQLIQCCNIPETTRYYFENGTLVELLLMCYSGRPPPAPVPATSSLINDNDQPGALVDTNLDLSIPAHPNSIAILPCFHDEKTFTNDSNMLMSWFAGQVQAGTPYKLLFDSLEKEKKKQEPCLDSAHIYVGGIPLVPGESSLYQGTLPNALVWKVSSIVVSDILAAGCMTDGL